MFRRAAEVAYFLTPQLTGRGIGDKMLSHFTMQTVHVRLHRAMARLRKILDSECTFSTTIRTILCCAI
jgi:hypothetical protein